MTEQDKENINDIKKFMREVETARTKLHELSITYEDLDIDNRIKKAISHLTILRGSLYYLLKGVA